ncbi:MAG: hypothetical protein A3F16_06590 [Deltaproteobacteria bacterium RIFCSPHIGHO2_12_FULL_43_9]|nr:MAG: hypothetical protein A3F16_06590 [Deltaproteobacteria bacterium RIFCSPHIGHO2_12_FULL_43_9]
MIWLSEIELHGFGPFSHLLANFNKGLNCVIGDNESGKSSLHTSILAILFGMRNVDGYRRSDAADFRGRMVWKRGDEELEIERSFSDDHVVVTRVGKNDSSFTGRVSPQGRSQDKAAYLSILQDWFGLEDELLFRASVFVEQNALQVEPNKEAGEQLSRLITGSEELPYEDIGTRLLDRYFEITQTNPEGTDKRQPRELEIVSGQIIQTERSLTEAEANEQEYNKKKNELEQTSSVLDQLDIASQKRRLKTETIAIDSEISLIEEQIEQRESIEEKILNIKEWVVTHAILIPAIGTIVAAIGGTLLGFLWPSLILLSVVLVFLTAKWFQNHNKLREIKLRLEGQLELLKTKEILQKSLEEAKNKINALKIEFNVIDSTPFDDMPEAQRRKRENEVRRERLQISERLAILSQRMRSTESIRELLSELIQRKDQLKTKAEAIYLGYQMLKTATIDFKKEAFERLRNCASEHFIALTTGMYKGLELDDNWEPMAITSSDQKRGFLTLSSGTRDSLLLSIRIAVGQLLSKDKTLPIILDDPIIYMDHGRRNLFLSRLRPISNEHQIIIFTFDRRLGKQDEVTLDLNLMQSQENR